MTQQVCRVARIPGTVESREACLQMTLVAFDIPPVPLKTRREAMGIIEVGRGNGHLSWLMVLLGVNLNSLGINLKVWMGIDHVGS